VTISHKHVIQNTMSICKEKHNNLYIHSVAPINYALQLSCFNFRVCHVGLVSNLRRFSCESYSRKCVSLVYSVFLVYSGRRCSCYGAQWHNQSEIRVSMHMQPIRDAYYVRPIILHFCINWYRPSSCTPVA